MALLLIAQFYHIVFLNIAVLDMCACKMRVDYRLNFYLANHIEPVVCRMAPNIEPIDTDICMLR